MKIKEIRELDTKDLAERLRSEVDKLQQLRLTNAVSPLENPCQIREMRRSIARMKTVLHERQLNNK